jgi:hypothetical protein
MVRSASESEGRHIPEGCFRPISDSDRVLKDSVLKDPRKPLGFLSVFDFGKRGEYIFTTHNARSDSVEGSVRRWVLLRYRPTRRQAEPNHKSIPDILLTEL